MKAIILAGGFGTRITEESKMRPKPMVEIGSKPILWHIMKLFSHYGVNEFIICVGYKQHIIKEYFASYALYNSNITFDFQSPNPVKIHSNFSEPWKVTIVDTGLNTLTGGRLRLIKPYVEDETFLMTYGDGLADIDINALIKFHFSHGKICTLTAARPEGRFGFLDLSENKVMSFREKSKSDVGYINGGFMVMNHRIFDYITKNTMLEREPLENLAKDNELMAYKHEGFWKCMDTIRDKIELENLWESGNAPWKVWE